MAEWWAPPWGRCWERSSIILLSQLGYVAALSGLVMAICTLKGL